MHIISAGKKCTETKSGTKLTWPKRVTWTLGALMDGEAAAAAAAAALTCDIRPAISHELVSYIFLTNTQTATQRQS